MGTFLSLDPKECTGHVAGDISQALKFPFKSARKMTTIIYRNIWELEEFSKVQKLQSLARMLTIHLSVNSDGFSYTMHID